MHAAQIAAALPRPAAFEGATMPYTTADIDSLTYRPGGRPDAATPDGQRAAWACFAGWIRVLGHRTEVNLPRRR